MSSSIAEAAPAYLTVADLGAYFGISRSLAYRLAQSLPHVAIGGVLRIKRTALATFEEQGGAQDLARWLTESDPRGREAPQPRTRLPRGKAATGRPKGKRKARAAR
jgi:hypothetical protein